jgi:hypothetical protein
MHEVRLGGGWVCVAADASARASARLTLPAGPDAMPAGRLRLTRRFQRPPRSPDEPAALRLRRVPGILSITINGRPLGPISPDRDEYDWPLGVLEPGNELAIVAEPVAGPEGWGEVTLVFGRPQSGSDEATPPA